MQNFEEQLFNGTFLVVVSETCMNSLAADDNKSLRNKNNEQQPIVVTKELDSKNKNSDIICNDIIPNSN